ncbi:zyxin-like, partial [Heterodontus francisci]|uniref:zyxin-like n=1 Tax=Heterodontus francisci TaxID=7792 RepID=UPI00355C48A1
APGNSSLDSGSSFESQIDSLNSMLNEMRNNDPYKAKICARRPGVSPCRRFGPPGIRSTRACQRLSASCAIYKAPLTSGSLNLTTSPLLQVNRNVGVSVRQGPAPDTPPGAPAFLQVRAQSGRLLACEGPQASGGGPETQPGPPPAPWAGPAKQRLPAVGLRRRGASCRCPIRCGAARPEPASPYPGSGSTAGGTKRSREQEAPTLGKSRRAAEVNTEPCEQQEEPRVQEQRDREPGFLSSKGADHAAPFTYKDVEELENLTKQFMQEMDKTPKSQQGGQRFVPGAGRICHGLKLR